MEPDDRARLPDGQVDEVAGDLAAERGRLEVAVDDAHRHHRPQLPVETAEPPPAGLGADGHRAVGAIAEEVGHHPALLTEWGKVTVTWWSHSIKGLHRNDFIMAARTDDVAKTAEGRFTGYVLVAFPAVMFLLSYFMNPGYAGILINDDGGRMLLGVAVGLQLLGLYAIKKITILIMKDQVASGQQLQLTVMSIPPGGEVGVECEVVVLGDDGLRKTLAGGDARCGQQGEQDQDRRGFHE